MTDTKETAAAARAMVTGPGTPDTATVTKPAKGPFVAIAVALAVACVFGTAIICILAWFVPWPASVAGLRVHFLGWMGLLSIGCIPVVVLAFATPWIGKISASAGAYGVSLESRDAAVVQRRNSDQNTSAD